VPPFSFDFANLTFRRTTMPHSSFVVDWQQPDNTPAEPSSGPSGNREETPAVADFIETSRSHLLAAD